MNRFEGTSLNCIRGRRAVFQNLDFSLEAGNALVLVGPNGSGKSSLLRILAGLLPPAAGSLKWNSQALSDEPEIHRARLCYIGHADPVKPTLTVRENLSFWSGMTTPVGDTSAALNALNLEHLADLPARFLSAGQKRRVNLARLALSPTDLWLLDEPATALDTETTARLISLISDHREAGGMVILSTHADLGLVNTVTLDLAKFTLTHVPTPEAAA